mgnify:CR=1 FL=1
MSRTQRPASSADREIVRVIYEQHKGVMYRTARANVRDQAEADDVVNDALMRLFRKADKLAAMDRPAVAAYVANTVFSAAMDNERRHHAERRRTERACTVMPDETVPGPEEGFLEHEERSDRVRLLHEALEELPEADRVLLVGKYVEGVSDQMLAARIGVKPASVRMKLTRARQRIKRIIERKEADGDA